MKIDVNGAYRAYTQQTATVQAAKKQGDKAAAATQDRVSLSTAAYSKSDLDRLAYSTAAEVEAKGSAARVSELKTAVAQGSYHVPSDKLTEAVLNTLI